MCSQVNSPIPTWIPRKFAAILFTFSIPGLSAIAAENVDGVAGMEWHPDFQVRQVAREPVVVDPVDLEFDENGNAFVLEMGGYPVAPVVESEFPGRIVMISDSDGDGVFDQRRVFAERFQYGTSILPYRGGLLVAAPPDLLFLKDTDGDGVADTRVSLMTGFEVGNAQHNYNGLIYGLDNWIYAGSGGNSGTINWTADPGQKLSLNRRDFRFRVDSREIDFICRTTSGFGIALDDWGHIFMTHNMRHIHHLVFPDRYLARNPYLSGSVVPEIADHLTDGLGRIYPIGVQEARVNHAEQSGFFSGACGITYYGGGAFPEGFNGNVLVADVVLNLVHRDVLHEDGPSFSASRGRPKAEFVASKDRSFRPVNMSVGPDGALYLIDFHRRVIEHPEWIPDELEKDMDLNAGKDKGRIYRIAPKNGLPRRVASFPRNDLKKVVGLLSDPNKWWRDTAQRLLVDWDEPVSVPLLEDVVRRAPDARARAHALWTLQGMGIVVAGSSVRLNRLRGEILARALTDPSPGVRENAVLIAEERLARTPALFDGVLGLANDSNARVRMQVALTLGGLTDSEAGSRASSVQKALLRIVDQDLENEWTRMAVLTGVGGNPFSVWQAFLSQRLPIGNSSERPAWTEGASAFVRALTEVVGAHGRDTVNVLRWLLEHGDSPQPATLAILDGMRAGLAKSGSRGALQESEADAVALILKQIEGDKTPVLLRSVWGLAKALGLKTTDTQRETLRDSAVVVADQGRALDVRLAHLRLLELVDDREFDATLFGFLNHRYPKAIQEEAMRQLARIRRPGIAQKLVALWPELGPTIRADAGDVLLYRSENHDLLLASLENDRIPMGQLNLHLERRRTLLRSGNPEIRRRAAALFTDAGVVTRAAAIESMKPALQLSGNPESGLLVFNNVCATCHKISGAGNSVGPDLTDIYRKSAETLLQDILDPNAAVNTEFLSYGAETADGELITGLLISETDELITLREPGGKETTLPRRGIEKLTSSGLSLMPEELESGLRPQDVADLISYLQQAR
ncbi:MAG: c-type cytochrome [Verrucomicrobia bacterium]|nr:c-type cytochrome [Verrucomicrobiota bacterium]